MKNSQVRNYAQTLTADENLRKMDWKGKALGWGARIVAFTAAEATIQAVVGGELLAGLFTGPGEILIGALGLGEEGVGAWGAVKFAGYVGRKVDEWYVNQTTTVQMTNVQGAWNALPSQPGQPYTPPSPPGVQQQPPQPR